MDENAPRRLATADTSDDALTPRQRLFALEYLVDLNATQAAIRAGYSKKSAAETGCELLKLPKVRTFVERELRKRENRLDLKADRVLLELMRVGMVDLARAFDDEGRLLALKDMPEDVRRAISGVEVEEEYADVEGGALDDGATRARIAIGRVAKVKFWDKPKALELLGKHLALFTEKQEVSGPGGGPLVVEIRDLGKEPDPQEE